MDAGLQILVTTNTEYHVDGNLCVGVCDVRTGRWDTSHRAVGAELLGCLQMVPNGAVRAAQGVARLGYRLYFSGDILTSPLTRVVMPRLTSGETTWERDAA